MLEKEIYHTRHRLTGFLSSRNHTKASARNDGLFVSTIVITFGLFTPMAPIQNGRVLFNAVPEDYPVPGETTVYDTSETIDLENVSLNGGILVKVLVLSIDPYMRGRLREPGGEILHRMPPFVLGQPLASGGIGVVLRSEFPGVEAGAHVRGLLLHQEYMIAPNPAMLEVLERDTRLDWSIYIGAAGMPGETAFMGWREYSDAKKGEVAFITTGGGPVGAMAIQIAKQDGVKVIASAGSEEKVKFMKEIGADVAFNYKTTDVREVLAKEGPIDIYWDNVGGGYTRRGHGICQPAREECGQISGYNTGVKPMKNPMLIVAKSLHVHGFLVGSLRPKYAATFNSEVVSKLASGEFKYTEDVTHGLEKVGDVILAVLKGTNTGKAVVRVAIE
ncbi:PKS-ER domain-containing protein [Mycena sanguinolenta]|uniref:PKS-ER domain-containing protein n=1 Tax=Mycena sanguinolenta TaxID=230812 RepID=A0A8H6ZIJ1_9AGAR|nr:PKS-ER domain-containing protein [Mycena sanguinolenta]